MDYVKALGGGITRAKVADAVDDYEKYHTQYGGDESKRVLNYTDMVNKYYDLSTSFYEYGWGQSFHFGHRYKGESLRESLKRHEHYLALNLELKAGQKVLDVGCGIGGPLREIAIFGEVRITGVNDNAHQVARANTLNQQQGGLDSCEYLKADFMSIPKPDNEYDAAYCIEATCHAPDLTGCFSEIKRVLKPGQLFAGYEWVLTEAYDDHNEDHKRVKANIEIGNGLPGIRTGKQFVEALEAAGFEVLRAEDRAKTAQVPWYLPLDTDHFSLSSFRLTRVGRFMTRILVRFLEMIKWAPPGSLRVADFLQIAAEGIVEGGKRDLFSAMFFFVARKPFEGSKYEKNPH